MRLPSRGNRGSPSLVSRSSSWRDRPDCVRWSTRPALVRVPSSATAATRRRCRVSRIMLDAGRHELHSYIIILPLGEERHACTGDGAAARDCSGCPPWPGSRLARQRRDVQGTRYSPAAEITRKNVSRLELAWTYRTGETDAGFKTEKATAFEATPLVVDGTMYIGTPLGRGIALDPATGRERWVCDPRSKRDGSYGDFASRGVSTWLDDSAPAGAVCRRRIFVATAQSQLFALDSRDRRPCAAFGRNGMVDLTVGLPVPPL